VINETETESPIPLTLKILRFTMDQFSEKTRLNENESRKLHPILEYTVSKCVRYTFTTCSGLDVHLLHINLLVTSTNQQFAH